MNPGSHTVFILFKVLGYKTFTYGPFTLAPSNMDRAISTQFFTGWVVFINSNCSSGWGRHKVQKMA